MPTLRQHKSLLDVSRALAGKGEELDLSRPSRGSPRYSQGSSRSLRWTWLSEVHLSLQILVVEHGNGYAESSIVPTRWK